MTCQGFFQRDPIHQTLGVGFDCSGLLPVEAVGFKVQDLGASWAWTLEIDIAKAPASKGGAAQHRLSVSGC